MEKLLAQCEAMLVEGCVIDDVISFLRKKGCSRINSIKAVMRLRGVTLAQAKEIVHSSKAWEDARENAEDLHDLFIDISSRDVEDS